MDALINAFKQFLMRDLIYILGGSAIILSFLFVYDRMPSREFPTVMYLLGVGFAYTLGYCIQEVFTLFHIVGTKAGLSPNRCGKKLYYLADRKKVEFPNLDAKKYEKAKKWLYDNDTHGRFIADHERTESLKQVGTTLGPCFSVSGIILLLKPWFLLNMFSFQSTLGIGALVIGLILIFLGWLKVTQQAEYLLFRFQTHQNQTDNDISKKA